jgi:hypothetical protein
MVITWVLKTESSQKLVGTGLMKIKNPVGFQFETQNPNFMDEN